MTLAGNPPPVVYIAGPIRAANTWEREQNIRRAEAVALAAWHAGAAAICPHTMGRFYDDTQFEMWIRGDRAILARCDAILFVEGWEASAGSRVEHAEAQRLGLPILHSIAELVARLEWLHREERAPQRPVGGA